MQSLEANMTTGNFPTNVVAKFFVACVGADAWAVGVARKLIPGAILRTREAAIHYASELALAAGVRRVHLDIICGTQKAACDARSMSGRAIHA
jgi:hypothetical protein